MRFKLDENLPEIAREVLSAQGHDVHTVADEGLRGAFDEVVLRACVEEDRILVTLDLDFSDIRAYPPGSYPGIWVLRPTRQTFQEITALLLAGVRLAATEAVQGRLWVIDAQRVRIREGESEGLSASSHPGAPP